MSAPQIVAECRTCKPDSIHVPPLLHVRMGVDSEYRFRAVRSEAAAQWHKSRGHDIRPVEGREGA